MLIKKLDNRYRALRNASILLVTVLSISGCSRAYIQVKNQHGDPVEDVHITAVSSSGLNSFFGGSNATTKYTNSRGRASFPVGAMFRINKVEKEGYQFRVNAQLREKYGNSTLGSLAKRFRPKNPLVIKAWKREVQPELTYVGGRVFFPDDIGHCTLKIIESSDESGLNEPITIRFNLETSYKKNEGTTNPDQIYVADKWRGWFEVPGAMLQDTDDLFLNRAPDSGYLDRLEYPYSYGGLEKRLFVRGKNDAYYGGGQLFIKASRGTKPSLDAVNKQGVIFQFWFNFDGDRNIMRDEAHTVWSVTSGWMDPRYECEEEKSR